MKMNQWVDFDIGDEAQSEYVFSYMGKIYTWRNEWICSY